VFEGVGTALITPFLKDGGIDEDGLKKLIEIQESNGVDFVVPCGTTGESATLSHEEHKRVVDLTIRYANRMKVLAGTGSNNTVEAMDLTRHAKDSGADGVLVITPYYNKPTPAGMIKHYEMLSNVDIPIIVYNVPGRTGVNIDVQTMLKISKLPNIVGVKEASGNISQIMNIILRAPEGFTVLSGDDGLTFPLMCLGARGVISVASNIVPGEMVRMVHSLLKGDISTARGLHFRMLPLFENLFLETNPIPVKTAMAEMGLPAGGLRLPLTAMDPRKYEILRKTLIDLGVLKVG